MSDIDQTGRHQFFQAGDQPVDGLDGSDLPTGALPSMPIPERRASTEDSLDRIDELTAMVEHARGVPMSSNCIVNRGEMLGLLDELRVELPTEIRRAQALLEERDKLIAAGQREADRIIGEAHGEHARLVSTAEVTVAAQHEANRIRTEAKASAHRRREETDQLIDTALANFEQTLQRNLAFVERSRDKLKALSEIGPYEADDEAGPLPF
ncbi:ATP synthase subunit B family protein [Fodinicola feengrottensis]|uniref:ATP synthase F0 subunit B n=1 Tax=Fodinicola feengrottensis TaxID=435914 RepID=A0ABP4T5B8_9ACTN|nr:hypothetical protein [Fodinicola feengrottensis]